MSVLEWFLLGVSVSVTFGIISYIINKIKKSQTNQEIDKIQEEVEELQEEVEGDST